MLMLGDHTSGIDSAASTTSAFWLSLRPVVATTSGTFFWRQVCRIFSVPCGTEKSITTSGRTLSVPAKGTCRSATPAKRPTSRPRSGFDGESIPATILRSASVLPKATSRRPIRPAAP